MLYPLSYGGSCCVVPGQGAEALPFVRSPRCESRENPAAVCTIEVLMGASPNALTTNAPTYALVGRVPYPASLGVDVTRM